MDISLDQRVFNRPTFLLSDKSNSLNKLNAFCRKYILVSKVFSNQFLKTYIINSMHTCTHAMNSIQRDVSIVTTHGMYHVYGIELLDIQNICTWKVCGGRESKA